MNLTHNEYVESSKTSTSVFKRNQEFEVNNKSFHKNDDILCAFSDSDWGGDKVDRKSVTGSVIFYCGNAVSWLSKKQSLSLSSCEAEYIAAASTVSEMLHIQGVIKDMNGGKNVKSNLYLWTIKVPLI